MHDESKKPDEAQAITATVILVDSVKRHQTKKDTLVVYKRVLTFKDGLLVRLSPSTASEHVSIAEEKPVP